MNLTHDKSPMNVIFTPDYSQGNPYQKELADALAKSLVRVSYVDTSGLFALTRLILKYNKTDVIHIHWIDSLVPLSTSRIKIWIKRLALIGDIYLIRIINKKLIWTVHNKLSHSCRNAALELFARRLLAKYCDKVIIHSPRVKKELAELYKIKENKMLVIPHGHYINSYENVVDMSTARKHLGLPQECFVYSCIGAIKKYKRYPELIETFKRLQDENIYLLIAGKPEDSQVVKAIQDEAKGLKNVKLMFEFISHEKVQHYLNASDVIVLPYNNILNSGAAILAMSFAKAVIAPRLGCLPDVLDPQGVFFFDPLVPDSLFNAMKEASGSDLTSMGQCNFNKIKQYDWDFIAKKTFKAYQHCSIDKLNDELD